MKRVLFVAALGSIVLPGVHGTMHPQETKPSEVYPYKIHLRNPPTGSEKNPDGIFIVGKSQMSIDVDFASALPDPATGYTWYLRATMLRVGDDVQGYDSGRVPVGSNDPAVPPSTTLGPPASINLNFPAPPARSQGGVAPYRVVVVLFQAQRAGSKQDPPFGRASTVVNIVSE